MCENKSTVLYVRTIIHAWHAHPDKQNQDDRMNCLIIFQAKWFGRLPRLSRSQPDAPNNTAPLLLIPPSLSSTHSSFYLFSSSVYSAVCHVDLRWNSERGMEQSKLNQTQIIILNRLLRLTPKFSRRLWSGLVFKLKSKVDVRADLGEQWIDRITVNF